MIVEGTKAFLKEKPLRPWGAYGDGGGMPPPYNGVRVQKKDALLCVFFAFMEQEYRDT